MGLLDGKVCMITGAGRGIGRETARRFAEEGAVLYVTDVRDGSLEELKDELSGKYSADVTTLYFDVTDEKAAKTVGSAIKKGHGRLDVLVNNAGLFPCRFPGRRR